MSRRLVTLGAALAATVAWASLALATETQLWITDSPADYARAEARGVLVAADGVLSLGPRAVSSPAESLAVIWAIAVLKDGSVALAGDDGRIERWTESGGVRPWVRLPVGQVLCLAVDGDGLVAGTGPDGVVYRIGARGDTAVVARTGERYVWGLAPAGRGAWLAATGTRGRIMRLEGGRARVVLDTDESNLVSMVSDGRGGAYAGGDSKGRVVHLRADGTARTVYDAAEDEVRAVAPGPHGSLYAAALTTAAVSLVADIDDDRPGEGDDRPQPARAAPATGGRAMIYRLVPDSSAAQLWTSPQPFVYALLAQPAVRGTRGATEAPALLAATGNRAGVYRITEGGHASQWLSAPQGQITALAADARGRVYAASSNPGALWRLGPEPAERGEILSSVLDARRFARFGRVRWRGDDGGGRVAVETRSGNTETPDTTWTPWSAAGSPPARYFQWKLELRGGAPRIDAVETAWREQNLPPRVDDLAVAPQGIGFREGDLQPRSEPVTQTLPGGLRVEYSLPPTPVGRALRELPAWARGLRTIQWRGSDPNGDPLRYRVDVRAENEDAWIELGEDLEATSFTWESTALPDGRYRIRVIASDATGNPVDEELTAEALSEPFSIDNTAPALTSFEARSAARAVEVSGRAEDEASLVTRLELSVDDGDWRVVSPEGGLADARVLEFRTRLADLAPGVHTIAVRAIDLAGNSTVRALRVTVPPRR